MKNPAELNVLQGFFNQDGDGDTYGSTNTVASANLVCTDANESGVNTDCDDTIARINPDAKEKCDRIDNNCDTLIDENEICARFWILMIPPIQSAVKSSQ